MEKDQLMKEFKEFMDAKYPDKKEEAPVETETDEEVKDSSNEELLKLQKELDDKLKKLAEKDSEIQKLKLETMGSNKKDESDSKPREIKFTPIDKI